VGSRFNLDEAYIAGFLDGDGSLMLQLKSRSDSTRGVRFMATICLYQDTEHAQPLLWMQEILKCGYISERSDGMTELRINGFAQVRHVLTLLKPYIRFKAVQAQALINACVLLEQKFLRDMSPTELRRLVDLMFEIKAQNYKSKSALPKDVVLKRLGLTP
jgi:LAGLIDADG endonuclease